MKNLTNDPLLTDLYQLTMLQGYIERSMHSTAVFEFYVRQMPESRGFLLAAGLEPLLEYLECLHFSQETLEYLSQTGRFSQSLLNYLADFRFRGSVHAMPEGTIFFPNEPVVRITASLPEAQLVESRLINLIHYQTLIATKAARCYLAARGRADLVDFGLRRAPGAEAGLFAARAAYIAGFSGTATILAEKLYGIPIFGTMAHSFIEAEEDEKEAFIHFALANPDNVTLLIDTYDPLRGTEKAVETAALLGEKGIKVRGIRLDSGDFLHLSKQIRYILNHGGFPDIKIFASGNMDEYSIKKLLDAGAPIDGFGVGTKLNTSADAPYLESAYKLMEYDDKPKMKQSEGKVNLPGTKQIFRQFSGNCMIGDTIVLEGERHAGQPLLHQFMQNGRRIVPETGLNKIRSYTHDQLNCLPEHLKNIETLPAYSVKTSAAIIKLKEEIEQKLAVINRYFCSF